MTSQGPSMISLVQSIKRGYHLIQYEYGDPRTKGMPLVDSLWPVLGIILFYNLFVLEIGPAFMRHRKPYPIQRLIQLYNLLQVAVCGYIVLDSVTSCYGPWGKCSWTCERLQPYGKNYVATQSAFYGWLYYMLKVLDLADTVFFVLRKKFSHITLLHVYHHSGMVLASWIHAKYIPGGQGMFIGAINCLVHSVMYTYYFLSSLSPEHRPKLWWKKYLTQLQIFQFLCIIVHYGQVLFQPNCDYPSWPVYAFLPHNVIVLYLFCDFYKKTYLTPSREKTS